MDMLVLLPLPLASQVEQLFLAKQEAVEAAYARQHIAHLTLRDTEPLRHSEPHSLPEATNATACVRLGHAGATIDDAVYRYVDVTWCRYVDVAETETPCSALHHCIAVQCSGQCSSELTQRNIDIPRRCWDDGTTATATDEFIGGRVEVLGELAVNLPTLYRATLHYVTCITCTCADAHTLLDAHKT